MKRPSLKLAVAGVLALAVLAGARAQPAQSIVPPRIPLVLVPGITGSVLGTCTVGQPIDVWPGAISNNNFFDDLGFGPNGEDRLCLEPNGILGGYLTSHAYDKTVDALARIGHYSVGQTLFGCPFDWRRSAYDEQYVIFEGCLQEAAAHSPTGKVDILAHSQGGLVAMSLQNHSTGLVRRVVTLGTPVLGAEKAVDMLSYMHSCLLGSILNIFCVPVDQFVAQKAIGTMPGVFELLPSPSYRQAVGHAPLVTASGTPLSFTAMQDFLDKYWRRSLLEDAEAFHRNEVDDFQPKVPMLRIVGYGQSTLVSIKLPPTRKECEAMGTRCRFANHPTFVESTLGDGTVPTNSADLQNLHTGFDHRNGIRNRYFRLKHLTLAQDDAPLTLAIRFFRARTQPVRSSFSALDETTTAWDDEEQDTGDGAVDLPADVPGDAELGDPGSGLQVEVTGDVSASVANGVGETLGPDSEFDGGSYGVGEGTQSFTLGAAGLYTTTVRAQSRFPITLLLRRYSGSVDQEAFFYLPSPVAGDVLSVQVATGQDLSTARLAVDEGGDGSVDSTTEPTAAENGDLTSDDATPPETLAGACLSGPGQSTVTLLGRDDTAGVGVAASYYLTAGASRPLRWSTPFTTDLYSTMTYLSVDRATNAEDLRSIVVDDASNYRELACPIKPGDKLERTIWPEGDEDWYRFDANGSSTYRGQIYGMTADYDLELTDADGNVLQAERRRTSASEQVRGVLPAGTYYLHVVGVAGAADLGHGYKIKLQTLGS